MSKLMGSLIDSRMKASWKMLEEWQSTIYSMMVFGATMVVMFWASVFLYTSFYFTYMPQESITWPIHLQYKSCGEQPGICSFPNSLVSVTDPNRGSLLARGQKYRVVVDLEMPESPTNQKSGTDLNMMSGMFLITMEMRSFTGDVLRKASRSSMLRYKSPLLQAMSTAIFAPFLIYGAHEEKQLVTAELFSQYEEDPVTPLSDVHIEIGSRNIEVYSAQLRIHATFAGLRHFMYYYPLTAAVFGIGVCMVFLSLIVLFSWYQFSMPAEKMVFGPGGRPNGRLSVEDISKEDFEKDVKEGTDDSRCTSSASETSYSPVQMETNTEVEGSGWTSFFGRKLSSTNDDSRENDTSRRSSRNVAAFVSSRNSSRNASASSSRRSSTRNDDTEIERKRSPSFFESIVGALATPEDTKDDIQSITLEVPPIRSRHASVTSEKSDATSKRTSWIFDDDSDNKAANDDENTKKELGSRKASWRSSWFGGDSNTDDKPEKELEEELLQQTDDFVGKEDTSISKRSSWRSSFYGGELEDDTAEQLEVSDSKEEGYTSKRSSWFGGDNTAIGTDEEKSSIEDLSLKISQAERRPSVLETMFGISFGIDQSNKSSRRTSTNDNIAEDTLELETQEDILEVRKSRASSPRSSFGIKSDTDNQEITSNRSSWFGGDDNEKDTKEEISSTEDSSLKITAGERRPSILETMFGMSFSTEQTDQEITGDDREPTTSVDRSSPSDSRRSSTVDESLVNLSGERKPSFIESMMGMMTVPQDTSSRRSSTGEEINNVLEVPTSSSRRSSRGSTRDNFEQESNNENDDTKRSSRRSSRVSTREDGLELPIIKSGSRRSSTSGRNTPRDVALDDAERLLLDANLVLRRKSSIKDSSIKRVSYLLDEDSSNSRRRSSTSEHALQPSDTTVDPKTRRKSSTSFIKQLLTEPSDDDEVEIRKTSRSASRDESKRRKSSTTSLSLDQTGDEFTAKQSRSPSVSSRHSRSSSPVMRVHDESHTDDQPRPVSGRLSYLFQESETENLQVSRGATAERRPSFIESMMGMLGGSGITAQDDSDNKEDEKE